MSNQGVRGFYQITETIKTQLLADVNVNTCLLYTSPSPRD